MNDDKLRPSPFSDGTSRLPESVSDEGNDVTGDAGAGDIFFDRRESTCTVPACSAVAVPQFYSQRCFIVLRTMRTTIELSTREREDLRDINDHVRGIVE